MDAGRGREGWSDRPRLAANITAPLGATNTPHPPPPLPLYRPVCAVQLLLACHSVSLPVRPFVSVWCLVFFSPLCHRCFAPPLLFVIPLTSCFQNTPACLDDARRCCPGSVPCLLALSSPPSLSHSFHSWFHCTN